MCGIVGIVGVQDIAPLLVEGLSRLVYRGYDSCGVATLNGASIEVRKDTGAVEEVTRDRELGKAHGHLGIAHTRWATHGGVSFENAHPHMSCDGHFVVVHNGIIGNHQSLRTELQGLGHQFSSQTDTEILAHLLEEAYASTMSLEAAFVAALRRLEGTFAIAMISTYDRERLFCAREKSPLIIGIAREGNFVGSDINAFLPYTRRAISLDDGEYAVLSRDSCVVRSLSDKSERKKEVLEVDWSAEAAEKDGYEHYMEKEIHEQPETVARILRIPETRIDSLAVTFLERKRRLLVGVGTTYFVALFGQYLLSRLAGEFAPAISSDEFESLAVPNGETLVLAVSQSGETFDTLQALRQAKLAGATTAAIVNVPGSTMTREAELVIQQDSGPEICVISTKAAMAQMLVLLRLAVEIGRRNGHLSESERSEISDGLCELPALIESTLRDQTTRIRALAVRYHDRQNWFFLARSLYTPIAFECALKMKEVTYLHAEGMPAGFLKHGTLSLVDESTLCVFLVPPKEEKRIYDLTMSSVEEVRARNGKTVAFCFDDAPGCFDEEIRLPKCSPFVAPLLQLIAGQVLAYETAITLGRNIDRPRSLAKSVTVS
jgi:glutamine---fructose-6-phosphate transaminase (isomerizing)